jgi:hypothetical protein
MHQIIQVEALEDYRISVSFADGTSGRLDLSGLAGHGVFAAWEDYAEFRKVMVGETGDLVWPSGLDLCPDALYLRLTGKKPEEEFPVLQHELSYA